MDYRETGGTDPLDAGLEAPGAAWRLRASDVLLRTRVALGLRPLAAPALVFVPLGAALGPGGVGLLPDAALGHLMPAVTLGLAALGVFVGLALELDTPEKRRLFAAASIEASITMAVVGAAMAYLLTRWSIPMDAPWTAAIVMAVAASASSAGSAGEHSGRMHRVATGIADLDDGLLVVAGGVAMCLASQTDPLVAVAMTCGTVLAGMAVGVAGWLLFESSHSPAERGVFVLGMLALAGGSAEYLGGSPLLSGLAAGICWRVLPGRADRIISRDVGRYQHPLVILILVIAGALVAPTGMALWLLLPFVLFRFAGKVAGGWAAARWIGGLRPADLAALLLAPGLLGLSLALNLVQVSNSPHAPAVLTAVALGTLASELLALYAVPGPTED